MLTLNNPTEDTMARQSKPRPPGHPGLVIEDILDQQGIGLREAARAIGMSHNGLDKVLKGLSPVTPETALRVGTYFGNPEFGPLLFLDLQREYDLFHARKALEKDLAKIVPLKVEKLDLKK